MFQRLSGRESGLAAYWNFDDGTANDKSTNGYNGIFLGNAHTIPMALPVQPCIPHAATATATVVNGFVISVNLTSGGCGYTNAPLVEIVGGGGTGATATAVVSNGAVTGVVITDAGIGYTNTPSVLIASPPFTPWLTIAVSQVAVTEHVVLGHNYVLESSTDLKNWTQVGSQFTAQSEVITLKFDVASTGQFFRIREVP